MAPAALIATTAAIWKYKILKLNKATWTSIIVITMTIRLIAEN